MDCTMFEFFNNQLVVHASWLYEDSSIMSFSNYRNLSGRKRLNVVQRGGHGRKALVEYDSLPMRFKVRIEQILGNPYNLVRKDRFIDYLEIDLEAKNYYDRYTLADGSALPEKKRKEYTANASILKAADKIVDKKMASRRALGRGKGNVWESVANVIAELPKHQWPHSLPRNYRRLKEKCKVLRNDGYEALIHKGFCNKNSEKLSEEAQLWVFSRWADRINKVPGIKELWNEYNEKSDEMGWPRLKESATIGNYLNQPNVKALWYGRRYGELTSKEKFEYQHSTRMASCRDALWYGDGTKLNYYYLNEDGKISTINVYEVMDAYSEVLLGYHISETENYEAQFYALKMSCSVSGRRPYELKFDGQGGHSKLKAGKLLDNVARLAIKTKPYNGKSKTIESAFGRFQQHYLSKEWYFTGQNITTKTQKSRANMENILANKANLPTLSEIKEMYRKRREEWNSAPHHVTGIPRNEMYRQSVNEKAVELTMWDQVDLFWIERPKEVTCTAQGITIIESKQKYQYSVFNEQGIPDVKWLRDHIDQKFIVKYDPEDMNLIYLYIKDALGLRFEAEASTKIVPHRAIQDQEDWEAQFYKDMKEQQDNLRIETRDEVEEILAQFGVRNQDYGMVEPAIKGLESQKRTQPKREVKKKVKPTEIGEIEKALSNATLIDQNEEEFNLYDIT